MIIKFVRKKSKPADCSQSEMLKHTKFKSPNYSPTEVLERVIEEYRPGIKEKFFRDVYNNPGYLAKLIREVDRELSTKHRIMKGLV